MSLIPIFIITCFLTLISWQFWRQYNYIQTSDELDEQEREVLMRQYGALLIGTFSSLMVAYFSKIAFLAITYVSFAYIAVSAIKNEVSILRGRGQSAPVKGKKAVFMGGLMLVIMVVHLIFVGVYFFNLK